MIRLHGREYGTAEQIAAALGDDIKPATVRRWADRAGLLRIRMTDNAGRPEVRYPLDQAAQIERDKRLSRRGRPRQLDEKALVA